VSGASAISNLLKILFLILLIIVLILGGIFWFDRLDLLNYKRVTGPLSQYLPAFIIAHFGSNFTGFCVINFRFLIRPSGPGPGSAPALHILN